VFDESINYDILYDNKFGKRIMQVKYQQPAMAFQFGGNKNV